MSEKNTGGPAFPLAVGDDDRFFDGMDLRDYFAAEAMKAWFPAWERDQDFDLCKRAYGLADAMLKTRES